MLWLMCLVLQVFLVFSFFSIVSHLSFSLRTSLSSYLPSILTYNKIWVNSFCCNYRSINQEENEEEKSFNQGIVAVSLHPRLDFKSSVICLRWHAYSLVARDMCPFLAYTLWSWYTKQISSALLLPCYTVKWLSLFWVHLKGMGVLHNANENRYFFRIRSYFSY